ncbi:energy transducer TonB [Accumulibacter sp.]|uniref:energy transducer TonB n=1 Tax=Accumulibacter sp. TaxID=2053492 RepID=UPI00257E941D|nr:energy transducer TonB [Accumulibacter sp.]
MAELPRRQLLLALLASLLAHAALLAPAHQVPQRQLVTASDPIVAKLADRPSAPGKVAAEAAARPGFPASGPGPREPSMAATPAAPRPPATRAVRTQSASSSRDPPAAQAGQARSQPAGALPAGGVTTAMAGGAAAREAVAADSGSTPAISADDLRQYRVDLAIASRRFKRYPALARERGWEGRVEVAVSVSAWQPRPQLSLVRSSGHAALDQQAVAMLEQASADTALPAGLRGRDFRILLPVEFTLDDTR